MRSQPDLVPRPLIRRVLSLVIDPQLRTIALLGVFAASILIMHLPFINLIMRGEPKDSCNSCDNQQSYVGNKIEHKDQYLV